MVLVYLSSLVFWDFFIFFFNFAIQFGIVLSCWVFLLYFCRVSAQDWIMDRSLVYSMHIQLMNVMTMKPTKFNRKNQQPCKAIQYWFFVARVLTIWYQNMAVTVMMVRHMNQTVPLKVRGASGASRSQVADPSKVWIQVSQLSKRIGEEGILISTSNLCRLTHLKFKFEFC